MYDFHPACSCPRGCVFESALFSRSLLTLTFVPREPYARQSSSPSISSPPPSTSAQLPSPSSPFLARFALVAPPISFLFFSDSRLEAPDTGIHIDAHTHFRPSRPCGEEAQDTGNEAVTACTLSFLLSSSAFSVVHRWAAVCDVTAIGAVTLCHRRWYALLRHLPCSSAPAYSLH